MLLFLVLSNRTVPRKCIALAFNHAEDTVYIADKSGDVYSYSLANPSEEGVLLVGHISMLLDVVSIDFISLTILCVIFDLLKYTNYK